MSSYGKYFLIAAGIGAGCYFTYRYFFGKKEPEIDATEVDGHMEDVKKVSQNTFHTD